MRERAESVDGGWQERARRAGCDVWDIAEFEPRPVGSHTAVTHRDRDAGTAPFVERPHDGPLRADIAAAAAGRWRGLILLTGGAVSGRTRSLYEAVQELGEGWTVIRPHDAGSTRRLPASGIFDRPCVIWLDDLHHFLAPDGRGLSVDVLRAVRDTATAPVVWVGSLWPAWLRAAPADDSLRYDRGSGAESHALVHHSLDVRRHYIRKVETPLADVPPVDPGPTADGLTAIEVLAGGRELLQRWQTGHRAARTVLEAAADLQRLGHLQPVPGVLLQATALALWRDRWPSEVPPSGWFGNALDYLTRPTGTDGRARALVPVRRGSDASVAVGYVPSNLLLDRLRTSRDGVPVPDGVWEALARHTANADDLIESARTAGRYGRSAHAEALLDAAAATGDPDGLRELARWLAPRPGRQERVESAFRAATAAGDPWSTLELAGWMRGCDGRSADVEATYRQAIADGDPAARGRFTVWLRTEPGREADLLALVTEAVAAGEPRASDDLRRQCRWLGEAFDPEPLLRTAVTAGHDHALLELAACDTLRAPGRQLEVEQLYRRAIVLGVPGAVLSWADWLWSAEPTRRAEAEAALRGLIDDGDPTLWRGRAEQLDAEPGRHTEVRAAFREAILAGDRWAAAALIRSSGGAAAPAEVEAILREALATGHSDVLGDLVAWLSERGGREHDIETLLRQEWAAGNPSAFWGLITWLTEQPGRAAEAEAVLRGRAEADPWSLAFWLSRRSGRESDAEVACRAAVSAGRSDALSMLARLLDGQGREVEREAVLRQAVSRGLPDAVDDLWFLLHHQPDRADELAWLGLFGLDAQGRTIRPS